MGSEEMVEMKTAIIDADREERLHAKLHSDGMCDCVRTRSGLKGGRERWPAGREKRLRRKLG